MSFTFIWEILRIVSMSTHLKIHLHEPMYLLSTHLLPIIMSDGNWRKCMRVPLLRRQHHNTLVSKYLATIPVHNINEKAINISHYAIPIKMPTLWYYALLLNVSVSSWQKAKSQINDPVLIEVEKENTAQYGIWHSDLLRLQYDNIQTIIYLYM